MHHKRRLFPALLLALALAACSARALLSESAGGVGSDARGAARAGDAQVVGEIATHSFATKVTTQAFEQGLPIVNATPEWEGLGFVARTKSNRLIAVQRRGAASIDQTGQVALYEFHGADQPWTARGIYDSPWDDRGIGGGVSPTGTIVVFVARYESMTGRWADMGFIRSRDDGASFSPFHPLSVGRDRWFSPYGPMIALPSGRLMQTFYGSDGRVWRLRVLFSNDDGKTWKGEVVVGTGGTGAGPLRPTEASAVLLGGRSDSTARILMIARTDPIAGVPHGGLVQYSSSNGGRTWRTMGMLPFAESASDVSPWLTTLEHGRVALVWAARGTMTIRVAIGEASKVLLSASRWGAPADVYRSRLADQRPRQAANFGYPAIASDGAGDTGKVIVFFDAAATDPSLFKERSTANTDLVMMRLLRPRCCTRS